MLLEILINFKLIKNRNFCEKIYLIIYIKKIKLLINKFMNF